jgi:prepilin-type N-terminal cleavage/methylation domain-containing protein
MLHAFKNKKTRRDEEGFTLVELSIVLVIIGLIVGGVLTGQDLIKAAQVRAEISQITNYNTATNTFREKYNGLPGDLLNGANYFSGCCGAQLSSTGYGNGNALIENAGTAGATYEGEVALFFYELNAGGLIPDPTNTVNNYNVTATTLPTGVVPMAKIPGGATLSIMSASGINYWVLSSLSGTLASPVWGTAGSMGLTVLQASQIDGKIDDGAPGTGNVISIALGNSGTPLAPATVGDSGSGTTTYCTTGGSKTAYNVALAATKPNCALSISVSF